MDTKLNKKQQQELIHYIHQLDEYRQVFPVEKLAATRLLFENKQYDLVISDLKRYIGISPKVTLLVKEQHCLGENTSAKIILPINFFQTIHACSHKYEIHITKKMTKSFENFVVAITHELSHLLLFIEGNSYWQNEKAVDILSIITGFGHEIKVGRKMQDINLLQTFGYLSDNEFDFVYRIFTENKRFQPKNISWYKKIWRKLKNLRVIP